MVLMEKSLLQNISVTSEIRAVPLIVVMQKCLPLIRQMQQTETFFMLPVFVKTEHLPFRSLVLGV